MLVVAIDAGAAAQDRPVAAVLRAVDRQDLRASALAPSPDGGLLLAYGDTHATVLTTGEGERRATIERPRIDLGVVANDGRFALAHGGGVTVHGADGREELRLGSLGQVTTIALSADGKYLAIGSTLALELRGGVDGQLIWSKEGVTMAVAFSATGTALIALRAGPTEAYDLTKGKAVAGAVLPTPPTGFRPEGCQAIEGGVCPVPGVPMFEREDRLFVLRDGGVERWRLLFAEQVRSPDTGGPTTQALWAGTDLVVAVGGSVRRICPDGTVRLDAVAPGCQGDCRLLGLGGVGDETWAAGPGGVQRWSGTGAPLVKKPRATRSVDVTRLHDGRWVVLGDDGRTRVGSEPGQGRPGPALAGAVVVDAAGTTVASAGPGGIVVAGLDGSERPSPSLGPGRRPSAIALSPDGGRLAIVDDQGALHVYGTDDARAVFRCPLGLGGTALAWSADAGHLFAGGQTLRVFASDDGREVAAFTIGEPVITLATSETGRLLVRSPDAVRTLDLSLLE